MSGPIALLDNDRVIGNGFLINGRIFTAAHVVSHAVRHSLIICDNISKHNCRLSVDAIDLKADLAVCTTDCSLPLSLVDHMIVDIRGESFFESRIDTIRPAGDGCFVRSTQYTKLRLVRVPSADGGGFVWLSDAMICRGDSGSIVRSPDGSFLIGIVLGNPGFSPKATIVAPLLPFLAVEKLAF